ncbi:MFS general substrate transporter [Tothia fuscella]|uniref:MFS general substrate transporter n=1 Tax=Tothia fuscella TaxID=1048955 RepID=A0A9P4NG58_9PEZI|nr:MFS general substrate transporter [Tothia fuscella]
MLNSTMSVHENSFLSNHHEVDDVEFRSSLNFHDEFRLAQLPQWTSDLTVCADQDSQGVYRSQENLSSDKVPPYLKSDVYPEGGTQAWLAVAGASSCLFVSFGWVNCVGVFQDYYQANQLKNYTPSEISWIPALQIFFMLFGGMLVGKVFDNNGPALLLLAGTFLHFIGLILTSLVDSYASILISQAVVSGMGASFVFFPSFHCVNTWFLAKRGAALGLVVAGSSLGGAIFPIMLIRLIPVIGFAWALRACAFVILVLLVFANFTLRSRLPPSQKPFSLAAFLVPLKNSSFLCLTAAVFFFYWGMFIPLTFLVVKARAQGGSNKTTEYLVPLLNGASIVGRTVPNAFADKFGHFNMMILMSGLTSALIFALWLPGTGETASFTFAALFGVTSGAGIGLTPALCAHIAPLKDIGVWTGVAFSISAFAGLTGSPIGGQILIVSQGKYEWVSVFAGCSCAFGTLMFAVVRIMLGGFSIKKV